VGPYSDVGDETLQSTGRDENCPFSEFQTLQSGVASDRKRLKGGEVPSTRQVGLTRQAPAQLQPHRSHLATGIKTLTINDLLSIDGCVSTVTDNCDPEINQARYARTRAASFAAQGYRVSGG
jgi:hypothetical protein